MWGEVLVLFFVGYRLLYRMCGYSCSRMRWWEICEVCNLC